MILIYDTETTGLYNFDKKPDHPSQPHLVQYAGLLVDPSDQRVVQACVAVVNPGVPIPAEATRIHGITTEYAKQHGVEAEEILDWHMGMLESEAKLAVAHNISFDRRIMDTVAARIDCPLPSALGMKEYCTMKEGAKKYKNRWQKLEQLHQHLFHESFQAHDALADVQACARCYFRMEQGSRPKEHVDMSAVPARCPLCKAEPSKLHEVAPGKEVPLEYTCGCVIGSTGKVSVPCKAGVPKA